jgi:hypothetical protein
VQQGLGNPQVGAGTDRQKFRQTFDDPEQGGQKIVVQVFSPK